MFKHKRKIEPPVESTKPSESPASKKVKEEPESPAADTKNGCNIQPMETETPEVTKTFVKNCITSQTKVRSV